MKIIGSVTRTREKLIERTITPKLHSKIPASLKLIRVELNPSLDNAALPKDEIHRFATFPEKSNPREKTTTFRIDPIAFAHGKRLDGLTFKPVVQPYPPTQP